MQECIFVSIIIFFLFRFHYVHSSSSGVDSFHHLLPMLVRSTPTSGSAYCKCIRQPVRMRTIGFAFACDMDHKSKAKRRVVQGRTNSQVAKIMQMVYAAFQCSRSRRKLEGLFLLYRND